MERAAVPAANGHRPEPRSTQEFSWDTISETAFDDIMVGVRYIRSDKLVLGLLLFGFGFGVSFSPSKTLLTPSR